MGVISQREAFGQALLEYGHQAQDIVVLDADTSSSTMSKYFANEFPERFFNVGIAEPCLVDVAVGLALSGLVPFINAFSALLSLRALEQIRTCVAYADTNVKIVAGYSGLSDYKDGPTHHTIMDIGIMRMLPGMTVVVPADENEIKAWLPVIAAHPGPVFLRLSRSGSALIHDTIPKVSFGKGFELKAGSDLTIIAVGLMVARAMAAAGVLEEKGVHAAVVEMPSIKPLDNGLILKSASETGAIVTAEEHSILGGLGSAVAEVLVQNNPIPLEMVGIKDTFARTGPDPDTLMDAYGLGVADIVEASLRSISRKKS
jgi:transketolase